MALVLKDRVRETTTTQGTGTVTLAGAVAGFQSFSAIGDANTTYYTINLPGVNEWEVGIGTYTASGTTLSRDTVLASSNSGNLVNFSAGTKDVFCTYPAGRSVYYDTATNTTLNALTLSGGTANGVVYLNASKVATSGSGLVFDGTKLSVNTAALADGRISTVGDFSAVNGIVIQDSATTYANNDWYLLLRNSSNNAIAGLSHPAANSLGVWGNDDIRFLITGSQTERMRLTSTGTLNIVGAGTAGSTQAVSINGSTPVNTLVTTSGGNVGIGTGSPAKQLDLAASNTGITTGDPLNTLRFTDTDTTSAAGQPIGRIEWYSSDADTAGVKAYIQSQATDGSPDADLIFATNHVSGGGTLERMRIQYNGTLNIVGAGTAGSTQAVSINGSTPVNTLVTTSGGNVGIGTNSPSGQLSLGTNGSTQVGSQVLLYDAGSASNTNNYGFAVNASTGEFSASAGTNGFFTFYTTNRTERARITSGGDFYVGNTTTSSPGDGNTTAGTAIQSAGKAYFSAATSRALTLNRNEDGNVASFFRSGSEVGSISVTTTATAFNTSSDYRLKDNPQPLTNSGAFIDALKPKTWNWKVDGSKGVGFIAHEVQEVSPGSVVGTKDAVDEDGKPVMQAMEYGSAEFIANIIAELQSLRARVAQLEQGA